MIISENFNKSTLCENFPQNAFVPHFAENARRKAIGGISYAERRPTYAL
jgi:hypothetical protein